MILATMIAILIRIWLLSCGSEREYIKILCLAAGFFPHNSRRYAVLPAHDGAHKGVKVCYICPDDKPVEDFGVQNEEYNLDLMVGLHWNSASQRHYCIKMIQIQHHEITANAETPRNKEYNLDLTVVLHWNSASQRHY